MQVFCKAFVVLAGFSLLVGSAAAAVTSTTLHGPESTSLDPWISPNDLIAGIVLDPGDPNEVLPGDNGWHPANTDPNDHTAAFTDGQGMRPTGLTGLLNDFPDENDEFTGPDPTKLIRYNFVAPVDIGAIHILTGNNGKDGRVFSTTVIKYSTDGGAGFAELGYFQSDPSYTENNDKTGKLIGSTLVEICDNASNTMLSNVTNLEFNFYSVDNTGGQMRDPFDEINSPDSNGTNTFTGTNDGLTAAFVSPLVLEIDVLPPLIPADMNGDGLANDADVGLFIDRLLNGPYKCEADMNKDGLLNGLDLPGFLEALSPPTVQSVPEPSALSLLGLGLVVLAAVRRRLMRRPS